MIKTPVVSFPEMVRTASGLGEARYPLGDRLPAVTTDVLT